MPFAITDFSPTSGEVGWEVTLTVEGLPPNTPIDEIAAYLGSDAITTFQKVSDTEIVVTIPEDGQTGKISLVLDNNESASTAESFTVEDGPTLPVITTLVPRAVSAGAVVRLNGTNMRYVASVTLGVSTRVPSWNIITDSAIQFTVPATVQSNPYYVYLHTGDGEMVRSPTQLNVGDT